MASAADIRASLRDRAHPPADHVPVRETDPDPAPVFRHELPVITVVGDDRPSVRQFVVTQVDLPVIWEALENSAEVITAVMLDRLEGRFGYRGRDLQRVLSDRGALLQIDAEALHALTVALAESVDNPSRGHARAANLLSQLNPGL